MREKSVIPTTLLDWPKVIDLLPEQKLILFFLWGGRYTNGIGIIQNPPLAAMAVSCGLSRPAFETGLDNLENAKNIIKDKESGEICVVDWFRFHVFKGVGVQIAQREAAKVTSQKIKNHLYQVAPWLFEASYPQIDKKQEDNTPTTSTSTSLKKTTTQPQATAAGGGSDVVVVFSDGSKLACVPGKFAEALRVYVDKKEDIGNRAGYARNTLRDWLKTGKPTIPPAATSSGGSHAPSESEVERLKALEGKPLVADGKRALLKSSGGGWTLGLDSGGCVALKSASQIRQFLFDLDGGIVRLLDPELTH